VKRALAVAIFLLGAGNQARSQAASEPAWDMDSLLRFVQPMHHSLDGFMAIRPQSLPIPTNNDAVRLRRDGRLRRYVDALWARGITTTVQIGGGLDTDAGALATALTVQEARVPIHVWASLPGAYEGAASFWPLDAQPNAWSTDSNGAHWPAFPLARPDGAYQALKRKLLLLKDNDPSIAAIEGMWMDYEQQPLWYFDVGAAYAQRTYASQYYTDEYAAGNGIPPSSYGPDLLRNDTYDSRNPMWRYAYDLRYALLKQSARKALTDVYGATPAFGNYSSYYSTASSGYVDNGGAGPYPPSPPPEAGIVAMPVAYANNFYLANDFEWHNPANLAPSRETVDNVYWYRMLTSVSTSAVNSGANGRTIPWVSFGVADVKDAKWLPWGKMSTPLYQELLRHIWLRGASGLYVFNRNPHYQPARDSFNELELARSVLDEMLSYREFLTNGVPMNYAVGSQLFSGGVEWSGRSERAVNPTRWLVRTVSRTGADASVSITPRAGLTFRDVPAPVGGATFLLEADGSRHRVDTRPATLYLNFDEDSHDGPRSTDIPGTAGVTTVTQGVFGLYANAHNRRSLALSGTHCTHVADAGGLLNAPSFTIEAFVRVDPQSADSARMLAKGADWSLQYHAGGQLDLRVGLSDGTTQELHTRVPHPLTDSWHHIALSYDARAPVIALYVDYAKVLGGRLATAMNRGTGDDLCLGGSDGQDALVASLDELRFTPEALDPLQFLRVSPLR
jgi:Concanavalin A-like lectin/glucanases superfamily